MRHCLALDLKNDPALIREYEACHAAVWPEVLESIRTQGITAMEIYRTGNRLFMIMETDETYSPGKKAEADSANPRVQEWEELMWKFQQPIPGTREGEKWTPMEKIFSLDKQE